ncbi:MAG TPA: GntR family transcriptional regulator [Myxococcaceae bacterium]|jgi:DNA-binding FadR family transcriptional regulator
MERVGLVAQVEAELEKMLALGLLPPDGKMPSEHGLARCFKVSRGTVREALRGLSAKGLVEQYPGRRTRVVAWDEALTLENLSVALTDSGRLRPGRMQLLEGFLALKRDITVELLVACSERASAAELEELSQGCFALADAARWDMGEGKWVWQEFALLRQAACALERVGHVLLIQSLERAFRGMAQWAVPHLDTGAVQAWAWCAMSALAEKNIQALKQKLPPLLQASDERLLSRLGPPRLPAGKSEPHPTETESHPGAPAALADERHSLPEPGVCEPHPIEAEPHRSEHLAAEREALPGQVVPNLSNSWSGFCEVQPTGASPPEFASVGACSEPESVAPIEDGPPASSLCCGSGESLTLELSGWGRADVGSAAAAQQPGQCECPERQQCGHRCSRAPGAACAAVIRK